jgi:hypothetical protein
VQAGEGDELPAVAQLAEAGDVGELVFGLCTELLVRGSDVWRGIWDVGMLG